MEKLRSVKLRVGFSFPILRTPSLPTCKTPSETPPIRKIQEGCGGLGGENPGSFPKAGPISQQPFSLLESAQTLAVTALRAP